jgi:PAP2 superfamily
MTRLGARVREPALVAVSGASVDAAVAAAAHSTLGFLFPSQRVFFDKKHQEAGLNGAGLDEGHAYGLRVATAILKLRKDDPDASDKGWNSSMAPGAHRPDPDNPTQGYHAPFYGARANGFAVTSRHGLEPVSAVTDVEMLASLHEVRGKGIAPELMGTLPAGLTARTAEQTLIGTFWGYDGAAELGTPPRLYNQIVRKVAAMKGNTPAENAKLFALVNAAMGDAGILAWEQKYIHNFWRPVVAIREADGSMGPAGTASPTIGSECDPAWLPLGAPNSNSTGKNGTPPFPAYPSGHATFGAAALQVTRLFYCLDEELCEGDGKFAELGIVSDELNGVTQDNKGTVRPKHTRRFEKGLWGMIEENGRSRVYLGVHWVFDAFIEKADHSMDLSRNIGGVPLGLAIAKDVMEASKTAGWVSPVKPNPS